MPKWLKIYVSGLLMGAADVVPGVSGGTIAFILGIYERLISALSGVNKESLKMLFKGEFKALWSHFDGTFLLVLGSGIATSIVLIAGIITHLLETYPSYLWGFFFGLILSSAYFLIRQVVHFRWIHALLMVLGGIVGAGLSLLVPIQTETSLIMVFFSGMIAICAMILPGISGSFLLLMMGMYGFVLTAIKSIDLLVVAVFGVGALLGLLSFSKVLHYLLQHARSVTLATLTGVMLGALVKVWPWKIMEEFASENSQKTLFKEHLVLPWQLQNYDFLTDLMFPIFCISVGFLSVILISNIFLRNSDK